MNIQFRVTEIFKPEMIIYSENELKYVGTFVYSLNY